MNETKAIVSVAEMARMWGCPGQGSTSFKRLACSRRRARQRDGRPVYTEELQKVCLEVRAETAASTASRFCFTLDESPVVHQSSEGHSHRRSGQDTDLMDPYMPSA